MPLYPGAPMNTAYVANASDALLRTLVPAQSDAFYVVTRSGCFLEVSEPHPTEAEAHATADRWLAEATVRIEARRARR